MAGSPQTDTSAADARRGLSSVTNALLVLEYLVDGREVGVSEIARHVGITVGTAHRLVGTLVTTGFAEQNPSNRKYLPSRKLVALAQRAQQGLDAREIAHQELVELVSDVHETGNIAILTDEMVLYTDKVTSDQPFGIEARVGSRLPAYCTALGKVLVSHLDANGVARYLDHLKTMRRQQSLPKPPAIAAFKAELRMTAEHGYAVDQGEYLSDVYCAAAPILDANGNVVAAMSISVPRSRFEDNQDRIIAAVQTHAATLSASLSELGLPRTAFELAPTDLR